MRNKIDGPSSNNLKVTSYSGVVAYAQILELLDWLARNVRETDSCELQYSFSHVHHSVQYWMLRVSIQSDMLAGGTPRWLRKPKVIEEANVRISRVATAKT